jgi:hypothetical protein
MLCFDYIITKNLRQLYSFTFHLQPIYHLSIMARMIEIEEQTLEMILDQKEAAEQRCLELELTTGLASNDPLKDRSNDGESYRISRPQWISFIHLCMLMGHPSHLDFTSSLELGRSDHSRCRLPQEEVEWLNMRISSLFGSSKLLLTVPVVPQPDLGEAQFSEHGYGDIYSPIMGLDLVIQEVDIYRFPVDPKWPQSLRVAWGTMTAYECLSSTFISQLHSNGTNYHPMIPPNHTSVYQGSIYNQGPSVPSHPMGRYDMYTIQGACPF